MLREYTLQPNEDKKLQVEGKYLVITQATGPLELTIGGNMPITVDEKDRVHLDGVSTNDRSILIKNVSGGVNTIELHSSDLLVDKRSGVDVKNSIAIAEDQRIGIDPGANIVQAVIQNVVDVLVQNAIQIAPEGNTVRIAAGEQIGFDQNQNTVRIAPGQRVGITPGENEVKAEVVNNLSLVTGQQIGIDPNSNQVQASITHPVEIKPEQLNNLTVNIADDTVINAKSERKAFKALPDIEFITPDGGNPDDLIQKDIWENPKRDILIVTADPANTDPIWIDKDTSVPTSGTPLFPGQRIELECSNGMFIHGKGNHKAYIAESTFEWWWSE